MPSAAQTSNWSCEIAAGLSSSGPTRRIFKTTPRDFNSRAAATSSSIPLSHNIRLTQTATGTSGVRGMTSGLNCSRSTPDPRMMVIRRGSMLTWSTNSRASSSFCAMVSVLSRLRRKWNATTAGQFQRMQCESLGLDGGTVVAHPCGDGDLCGGFPYGARNR